jgi:hypothetical protein
VWIRKGRKLSRSRTHQQGFLRQGKYQINLDSSVSAEKKMRMILEIIWIDRTKGFGKIEWKDWKETRCFFLWQAKWKLTQERCANSCFWCCRLSSPDKGRFYQSDKRKALELLGELLISVFLAICKIELVYYIVLNGRLVCRCEEKMYGQWICWIWWVWFLFLSYLEWTDSSLCNSYLQQTDLVLAHYLCTLFPLEKWNKD